MLDYEVLRVIWWALVGVLLIGFAITPMVSIWALVLCCQSSAKMTMSAG